MLKKLGVLKIHKESDYWDTVAKTLESAGFVLVVEDKGLFETTYIISKDEDTVIETGGDEDNNAGDTLTNEEKFIEVFGVSENQRLFVEVSPYSCCNKDCANCKYSELDNSGLGPRCRSEKWWQEGYVEPVSK